MVTVDRSPSVLEPGTAGRAHRAVEPLHAHLYFAPEHDERFSALGLKPGRMSYFAGRAAPMGAVGAGVVTATFYKFSPSLVAHMIPRAWALAAPAHVVTARLDAGRPAGRERVAPARLDAGRASLTRLLRVDVLASPELVDLAGLLRAACAGL